MGRLDKERDFSHPKTTPATGTSERELKVLTRNEELGAPESISHFHTVSDITTADISANELEIFSSHIRAVAHDLNNLLTGIADNAGLLKMRLSSADDALMFSDEIETLSIKARDLIAHLQKTCKGELPEKEIIDTAALVRESGKAMIRDANINCELLLPDNLWHVEANRTQISRVIDNLLINAQQAMPEGGKIRVAAENIHHRFIKTFPLRSGKYVKIAIKDQGTGISEKNLQNIFQPLFTTKKKGTGLGLAIANSILIKCGGLLTAGSTLGIGTTFIVYLPAAI